MKVSKQEIADIILSLNGSNASSIHLPDGQEYKRKCKYDNAWSDWVRKFANTNDFIGRSVAGGEFVAYKMYINGSKCALILFSWLQGGFDSPVLVDGHPDNIYDAGYLWLGDTNVEDEEYINHPIRKIIK